MMTDEFLAPDSEDEFEDGPFSRAKDMAQALEASGVGLWQWRLQEEAMALDGEARRLLNLPEQPAEVSVGDFDARIHPSDLEDYRRSVAASLNSTGEIVVEFRRNDHSPRSAQWLCLTGRVVERDGAGRALRAAGTIRDVSEQHFEKEASELLNRELAHRMKNLFSVVGSIASVSAENRPEAKTFVRDFQSRLNSLSAAHDLLKERQWLFMPLELLASRVIEPLGVLPRIDIQAGNLMFGDYDMQTLVLVLHELATNALKYGALSNESGHVSLRFDALDETEGRAEHIVMTWREIGGPPVSEPTERGFGTTLLQRLARRHGHEAPVIEWHESGLSCQLRFQIGTN